MTETTAERINRRVRNACDPYGDGDIQDVCDQIAAEIDGLAAQLAEARAEVERLRPAAEAWDKREALVTASKLRDAALWEPGAPNLDRYRVTKSAWLVAEEEAETAAARAREAAKGRA